VLTLYVPFAYPGLPTKEQGINGRTTLLSTPFINYERQIREQFTEMFGRSGFDAQRDIAGIILNRWGHAFVNPQPGFFFGVNDKPAPRDLLRNSPFGRIAFANTDLSGVMDHPNAVMEGQRAAYQVLGWVT
jgi:spermidine dehydrogenase